MFRYLMGIAHALTQVGFKLYVFYKAMWDRLLMTDFYKLTPEQQEEAYKQLAELVLPEWGLQEAGLGMIKMRENAVFKVETPEGNKQVLRIHRAGYHSDDALRSELQWIQALAKEGIETPQVIPTNSDQLFVVPDSTLAGLPRQIDMFAWVDGEQLGSVEDGVEGNVDTIVHNFRAIGDLAARVHNQSSSWQIPDGFERHAWDVDGLAGEQPFWGRFWELEALSKSERELMIKTKDRVREDLITYGQSPQNYSMIHADMVPENVLVDGAHTRLIDFDDAGFGWHLFEIATSLYFYRDSDPYEAIRDACIEGYRAKRPLSDKELAHLPLFLLARGTTYLGWVYTRSETETAQELTPMLIGMVCPLAEEYLSD
jgi:Ser/Thr protein kinase RdoA (MazF antagonist)